MSNERVVTLACFLFELYLLNELEKGNHLRSVLLIPFHTKGLFKVVYNV